MPLQQPVETTNNPTHGTGQTEPSTAKANAWLLLSGGVDSAACLKFLLDRGYTVECFYTAYGQPASVQEEAAARRIAHHFDVPLAVLRWSTPARLSAGEIIGRNALLLLGALTQIGSRSGILVTGLHKGTPYFDSSRDFLTLLQSILDGYSGGTLRLAAPFIEWSKPQILAFSESTQVPIHLTYSCEAGGATPCGACLSCRDRCP